MTEICDFLGVRKTLVYRTLIQKQSRWRAAGAAQPQQAGTHPGPPAAVYSENYINTLHGSCLPACATGSTCFDCSVELFRIAFVAVTVAPCTRLRARATQQRVSFTILWHIVTVRAVRKRHAALGVPGNVELRMWTTNSPASGGRKPLRTFFAAPPCGSTRSVSKSRPNSSAAPSIAASRELFTWPAGADACSRS